MSQALTPAETPLPAIPLAFGFGPEIDQILLATHKLQASLFSPHRNKTVDFVNKKGQRVKFRYASLSAINDMIREPMQDAGLLLMHFPRSSRDGTWLFTRLMHVSGQYFEAHQLLRLDQDAGMQDLGSAMTYARRYATCSLLNIAGDEDDDANLADGNTVHAMKDVARNRSDRERYNVLIHKANVARKALDIQGMLGAWAEDRDTWQGYADREDTREMWQLLVHRIAKALEKVHGEPIAEAWRQAMASTTEAQMEAVRERWDSEWKPAVAAMKESNPRGLNMLAEQLRAQLVRVQLLDQRSAAATPVQESQPAAAEPVDLALPQTEQERDQAEGPYLYDEFGEIASDRVALPTDFATMYVTQARGSDDLGALEEHNANGLAWCESSVEARVILMQGLEAALAVPRVPPQLEPEPEPERPPPPPPAAPALSPTDNPALAAADMAGISRDEPAVQAAAAFCDALQPSLLPDEAEVRGDLVVPVPVKARGTTDLSGYLKAAKESLARVQAEQLQDWFVANKPVFDRQPPGTRMQCMSLVASRMKQLGVEIQL